MSEFMEKSIHQDLNIRMNDFFFRSLILGCADSYVLRWYAKIRSRHSEYLSLEIGSDNVEYTLHSCVYLIKA